MNKDQAAWLNANKVRLLFAGTMGADNKPGMGGAIIEIKSHEEALFMMDTIKEVLRNDQNLLYLFQRIMKEFEVPDKNKNKQLQEKKKPSEVYTYTIQLGKG